MISYSGHPIATLLRSRVTGGKSRVQNGYQVATWMKNTLISREHLFCSFIACQMLQIYMHGDCMMLNIVRSLSNWLFRRHCSRLVELFAATQVTLRNRPTTRMCFAERLASCWEQRHLDRIASTLERDSHVVRRLSPHYRRFLFVSGSLHLVSAAVALDIRILVHIRRILNSHKT